ncbi:MAG: precorrin-6y C5,15-methyltransferase (decarboxylating) subunit CbiE, partial [Acidobacteriota bacterium]
MDGANTFDPQSWMPPRVVLVGIGMGADDISRAGMRWIERAEVIAGGRRHLELFPDHAGEHILLDTTLAEFLDKVALISKERRTVVLASGDPLFFGVGRRLAERVGRERLFTVPNVTSVQAVFARLCEPWEDVKVVSLHGRRGATQNWMRELRYHARVALLTDPENPPNSIARRLIDAGLDGCSMIVAEDMGLPSESVRRFSTEEAAAMAFSPLNIVVVRANEKITSRGPALGLPESAFRHQAGLITKMEIRAVALACLQLEPDLVMWDLGAGSGSVSIEASRLVPLRRVVAVERNADRYEDILENVKRFGCTEVVALHGDASKLVGELPDPDRVFIGGSGEGLEVILAEAVSRLRPGGRIVQTVVTLDTLERV